MNMHKDIKEIMFTKQELDDMIRNVAYKINKDFEGDELVAVIILKGSMMFAADLIRCLTMNIKMDFMQASSYGSGTVSTGVINIKKDIDTDIKDKNVLVVEDIIDSGLTLSWLKTNLESRGPASVEIVTLLRKPEALAVDIDVKYIGRDIPNEFVVGYGLDFDQKYRNLDVLGTLAPHVYQ